MTRWILTLLTLVFASSALAMDASLEFGIRQQSANLESDTQSVKSQTGYQLGAVAVFPVAQGWGIRTGLMYVSRPIEVEDDISNTGAKITMNYFEVPVALSYKFEDYANVFAGVALSMHLDSATTNKFKVNDVKSTVVPLVVGASFKVAPQIGGTLFFETASGEAAQGLKNYRAVGASLAVFFE